MKKPTRAECLKWADECDAMAERYLERSRYYREQGDMDRAGDWANWAGSRAAEAKALRAYAEGLDA